MVFETKFGFGEYVILKCSKEQGEVIGVAFYPQDEDRYLLRYKNGAGNAVEIWWPESAIEAI